MSIYGPNFMIESMKDLIHGSSEPKTFSYINSGVINRQDMARRYR